jgi:membrane-bound serine protease (ClpP class)
MYNQFMNEMLLNPNFAYLVLVVGLMLTVMAVITPGTGLYEAGAAILLVVAGWEVYNLPTNLWALFVLLLAVIFFLMAFRPSRPYLFLGLSILALVVGSAFLFRGDTPTQPAVNPLLALVASVLSSGFIWVGTRKALDARRLAPVHNLEDLIGALGEAKTAIHEEGSVQVAGELWSAHSEQPISAGASVRVVGREGFILQVEATTR